MLLYYRTPGTTSNTWHRFFLPDAPENVLSFEHTRAALRCPACVVGFVRKKEHVLGVGKKEHVPSVEIICR